MSHPIFTSSDIETFFVRDTIISFFSSETSYGYQTVAEINGKHHYLGDQAINIIAAIMLWEKLNDVHLTDEEIERIMTYNGVVPLLPYKST